MKTKLPKAQSLDNGSKMKNLNLKNLNDVLLLQNEVLKKSTCLYFLLLNNEIQYIGITDHLNKRLYQHKRKSVIVFDDFRSLYGSFKQRDENELIKIFKPVFNKAMNPDHLAIKPMFNGKNLIGRNNWEINRSKK